MPRREASVRDQDLSAFARILQNLIDAIPGVAGAALVDNLGECVDYAGVLDPFDIKVASAHLQLELRKLGESLESALGQVHALTVCAQKRSFVARHLVDDYSVIFVFTGGSPFHISSRAFAQAEYDLRVEGGWEPRASIERWVLVGVEARPHDRWRPRRVRIANLWHDVEVLGAVVGLTTGERGYRVRTSEGEEMTVVRERQGRWFADIRLA
jgi:hypothetical protein